MNGKEIFFDLLLSLDILRSVIILRSYDYEYFSGVDDGLNIKAENDKLRS